MPRQDYVFMTSRHNRFLPSLLDMLMVQHFPRWLRELYMRMCHHKRACEGLRTMSSLTTTLPKAV